MTTGVHPADRDLPRTVGTRHPTRALLHGLRPAFAAAAHRRWDITQRGTENVPVRGPVVLAGNHIGFLDGPLMAIVGPRPVHALTKSELFAGPLGTFLLAAGQIPVVRGTTDPAAVKTALRVLRAGGVAGLFPETTRGSGEMHTAAGGAAYLAMATGASVVPVAFLGTRLPGSDKTFPPAGTRIVISYAPALQVPAQPWPRRRSEVRELTERIRQAVITAVRDAEAATGMTLPGPLPGRTPDSSSQEAS